MKEGSGSTAVMALDAFGFRYGSAQTNREIIGKMIAANRNSTGVTNDSAAINNKFGSASANIKQADSEITFILREASFRGSERLNNGVADQDSSAVGCGYESLCSGHRGSNDVQ